MSARKLLYIMRCGTSSLFKIGISTDPRRRCAQLQTGCPYVIKLVFELVMDTGVKARSVERVVHDHLKAKHAHGEWFSLEEHEVLRLAQSLLHVGQNKKQL